MGVMVGRWITATGISNTIPGYIIPAYAEIVVQ
jgi:hypothetical protein